MMSVNNAKAGIRKYLGFALDFFGGLDKKKKILFISGAIICLVMIIVLIVFTAQPRFVPLYTDIDTQDAAAITQYLKDKKIPFELSDEGSTILVPEPQKYQTRLDLANENLPKGNVVGFESFDKLRFGETESTQKVRLTAALQGELERTISKIAGVDDVRVHIVRPEQSLFVEDKNEATSSVFLELKPGYDLQPAQVRGITRLVASGVEGLKPENVTVIDSEGNVLSDNIDDANQTNGKLTTNQMEFKLDYEKQLDRSLQTMLERVVGSGKAVVRSSVVFDFDQVEIHQEDYGDKQVKSSHTTDESSTGASTGQGQPGTGSNIPNTYQQVDGQDGTQQQKTEKITDYEIDKETTHRVVAPGQVKQLAVSVLLGEEIGLQKQQMIADMVASAAGIRPESEDRVTVTCLPFNSGEGQTEKGMGSVWNRNQLIIIVGILLALVVALLLFWLLRKNKRETKQGEQEVLVQDLLASKQQEVMMPAPEDQEKIQMLEQLRKLAKDNSKETVEVLRSWLSND